MKKGTVFIYPLGDNLYINLTNRCCNDCAFCLRRNGDGVKDSTLWLEREPTAAEVIDRIKNTDMVYDEAVFCGYGESTYKLNEMLEIADYLHSIGKKTRLNTNGLGSGINGFNIAPKLKGRIDTVSVSLNESDAERYDKICRSSFGLKAYKMITDFAAECVKEGIKTFLTVVDVIPPEEIEKCRATAEKIGARLRVRKYISDNEAYN